MGVKRKLVYITTVIILILAMWVVWQSASHKSTARHHLPITVTVTDVIKRPMPIEITQPGQIEAVTSVSIRSQVTGLLQDIAFTPGDTVQKGDLLFQINPDSFALALSQAKATLARDRAQYLETKKDTQRLATLYKNKFVSEQQYSQSQSQLAMQKATLTLDEEKVKEAALQLSYTKITSPVTGKTGNVAVKIGDLITAQSADPLVVINEMQSVYVTTYIPQRQLPKLLQFKQQHPIQVEVWDEENEKLLAKGEVVFVDNTVDSQSGTVLLKALVANNELTLWPAQLVTANIILTIEPGALVIPSQSVFSDDQGQYIYLLKNNHAALQRVIVDRQVGALTVIKSGVKVGDQVITQMPPSLQNNAIVQVKKPSTLEASE